MFRYEIILVLNELSVFLFFSTFSDYLEHLFNWHYFLPGLLWTASFDPWPLFSFNWLPIREGCWKLTYVLKVSMMTLRKGRTLPGVDDKRENRSEDSETHGRSPTHIMHHNNNNFSILLEYRSVYLAKQYWSLYTLFVIFNDLLSSFEGIVHRVQQHTNWSSLHPPTAIQP